jgi:hypothetical protein
VLGENSVVIDNQVEWPIPDLLRHDGQDLSALVDHVAGAVEDVQDARLMGAGKPVVHMPSEGKGVTAPHYGHLLLHLLLASI